MDVMRDRGLKVMFHLEPYSQERPPRAKRSVGISIRSGCSPIRAPSITCEPAASLGWLVSSHRSRERAPPRRMAHRRVDADDAHLQTDGTPPPARTGFFLTFLNSFNEWHEGTQFEPVKDAVTLTPHEESFGYHNPVDRMYRLNYLKSRLQPILQ